MPNAEEAAAAAAAKIVAGDEAPEGESSEKTVAETQETVELPSFEVEVPEELEEELELEDDELEVRLTASQEEFEDYGEDDLDPEVRARLVAAEKKAAFYEKKAAERQVEKAEEEARKFFPLSEPFLSEIEATSRRGFLRQAKAIHQKMLPIARQMKEQFESAIETERERVKEETKKDLEKAWGRAVPNDPAPQVQSPAQGRPRRRGELSDTIREMLFTGSSDG